MKTKNRILIALVCMIFCIGLFAGKALATPAGVDPPGWGDTTGYGLGGDNDAGFDTDSLWFDKSETGGADAGLPGAGSGDNTDGYKESWDDGLAAPVSLQNTLAAAGWNLTMNEILTGYIGYDGNQEADETGLSTGDVDLDGIADSEGFTGISPFWSLPGVTSEVILAEVAGYAQYNAFGIYIDGHDGAHTFTQLFSGADGPGDSAAFFPTTDTGFYLDAAADLPSGDPGEPGFGGDPSGTDDALLSDRNVRGFQKGRDLMLVWDLYYLETPRWATPNRKWLVGFEDLIHGDFDYQDFIVTVEVVGSGFDPPVIPEPNSLILIGTGIFCLAGVGYRRARKRLGK